MNNPVLLWSSKSEPGKVHKTWFQDGAWRCTCHAGKKGSCWHLTVARKLVDCGTPEQIAEKYGVKANWI